MVCKHNIFDKSKFDATLTASIHCFSTHKMVITPREDLCRLFFVVACAYLGPFSFGYTIGYSSPAIPQLEYDKLLVGSQSGWFGSLLTVGAMLGGPAAGWLVEKYGRKWTINISSFPFILGWLSILHASSVNGLLFGRLMCGFASGMITVCAPIYIAEVSTSAIRGMLGAGVQLLVTIGILVAYVAGMYYNWYQMALIGIVPAVLSLILMLFVPETPRWLLLNDRKSDAVKALAQIRSKYADIQLECRDIEDGLDVKETFLWSEFKKPELFRPLTISLLIMLFQQFSGINAVMFYTVSIFKDAGLTETGSGLANSNMATVIIGAVQVAATLMACYLIDKLGRRKLLIIAGCLMCLSCFFFGIYYQMKTAEGNQNGQLAIICLVVYIIGFSLGWGPVPMLLIPEIFPSRARGTASSIANLTNWFCAFIVTKEFVFLQEVLGPAITFWLFALSCMVSVLYVWKRLPETKGKSLEDIELYFLGKSLLYV